VGEITADVVKKLRDHGNRIERLEKVEYPKCAALSSNPGETASALTTDQSGHLTLDQLDATTLHATTLLADHIGEHTGAHGVVVNNTLSLGNQSTAYMEQKIAGVNDEASTDASSSGALYGLFYIGCPNEFSACLCICDGIVSIISDRAALYSITDTDGKHCLLVSAGKLTVKNRRGGALSYYITHIY
jgi:hypothetical protein